MKAVSVIIPSFNRAYSLSRSINSVLHQSFKNWELWIIDDGSTDGTKELVLQFIKKNPQHKIYYIKSPNLGVSHARNLGIKLSCAPWVCLLDSDDEWLPHKLKTQYEVAKNTSLPLIHSEELWVRNGKPVTIPKKYKKVGGRQFTKSTELCCISPSTVMIKKEIFKQLGFFNTDFPVCEDYEMWLRITSRFDIAFIPEPLIKKYGGHEDQLSSQFFAMDEWRLKALLPYVNSPQLSEEEKQQLRKECQRKAQILITGFNKHNRAGKLLEWSQRLDDALGE